MLYRHLPKPAVDFLKGFIVKGVKGLEDVASLGAASVPTDTFLQWQNKWQQVHPEGALPPLTSARGQQLLQADIAAGRIEPPPTNRTLGHTVEQAYTQHIDQPWTQAWRGNTGGAAFDIGGVLGEWAIPSMLPAGAATRVERAIMAPEAATTLLSRLIRAAQSGAIRTAIEAPTAKAIVEARLPQEEHESTLPFLAGWLGSEVGLRSLGTATGAAREALGRLLASRGTGEAAAEIGRTATVGGAPRTRLGEALQGLSTGAPPEPPRTTLPPAVEAPATATRIGEQFRVRATEAPPAGEAVAGRPATPTSLYAGLANVRQEDRAWVEMLASVREFWANRRYTPTDITGVTKRGQAFKPYERNVNYARQQAQQAERLLSTVAEEGRVNEDVQTQASKMFNAMKDNRTDKAAAKAALEKGKAVVAGEMGPRPGTTPSTTLEAPKTVLTEVPKVEPRAATEAPKTTPEPAPVEEATLLAEQEAASRAQREAAEQAITRGEPAPGILPTNQPTEGGVSATAGRALPKELAGAKPRYSYRDKQFTLKFESDVDRALYIVAQEKPSKRDADYMQFLREVLPGVSDDQLRERGKAVRGLIKSQAKDAKPGELRIGATGADRPTGVVPTGGVVQAQPTPAVAQGLSDAVEALVAKEPNKRSALSLLNRMKKAGYDTTDAQSYLDEYDEIMRADFDDINDYKNARREAYDQFLDSLRDSVDQGPEPGAAEAPLTNATPVGKVIEDVLQASGGSEINPALLTEHPDVKAGLVTHKQLVKEMERRGLSAGSDAALQELNAGLHPQGIRRALLSMWQSHNTSPTFKPIQEVTTVNRSVPNKYLDLLPDVEIVIGERTQTLRAWLDEIDRAVANENHQMERILLENDTVPQFLPEAAKARYNEHVATLAKFYDQRELLREPVETLLGEFRKGQYSKSLASQIDQAKLMPEGSLPAYSDGALMGYWWESPAAKARGKGPEFYSLIPEATKLDESIWRSQPTLYARYLGQIRDVFGETLVRPFRNAYRQVHTFEGHYQTKLYEALKPIINNAKSLERVTLILEGTSPANLTAVETKAAAGLREWYNGLFKEFGIEPERFLTDYAPRIRQYGSIRRAFQGTTVPKELQFFAELERTAEDVVFPTELNSLSAAMDYLRLGARKKFLQPAFDATRQFVGAMHPDRQLMWKEFENSILHRPIWEERLLNGVTDTFLNAVLDEVPQGLRRRYAREIFAFVTHMGYLGTMGGNLSSVLKNLTQQSLALFTLSKRGNPLEGLYYMGRAYRALRTKEGQQVLKFCEVLSQRQYVEGLNAQIGMMGLDRYLKPVEQAGFYLFEASDRLNVKVSYLMKLLQDLDAGKSLSEAVEHANVFAADTQFLYGMDSPMMMKHPLGRVLGMLFSWPINYMRLLQKQGIEQGALPVLVNIAGMTSTAWLLSRVTGIDFSTESPVGGIFSSWLPVSYMVSGDTSLPVDTLRSIVNLGRAALNDAMYGTSAERDAAMQDMVQQLYSYIPFYTEGRRVSTVAKALQDNLNVRDKEGKITYRYGEVEVPGAEPTRAPSPGGLIPEQLRALVGPTVEQSMRRSTHERISKTEDELAMLRDQVVRDYLAGNMGAVRQGQERIKALGGNPVTRRALIQRLQQSQKTAIERQAEGLKENQTLEPSQIEEILRTLQGQVAQ